MKERTIYINHPATSIIGAEEGVAINEFMDLDTGKAYRGLPDRLIELQQQFIGFWRSRKDLNLVNIGDKDELHKLSELKSDIRPYAVPWNYKRFEYLLDRLNGRYFGSELQPEVIHRAARDCASKAFMVELVRRIAPSLLNPELEVYSRDEVSARARKGLIEEGSKKVIKSEYSNGGFGSIIISSDDDLRDFLQRFDETPFQTCFDPRSVESFLLEDYIEPSNLPCIYYEITDKNISQVSQINEREVVGLSSKSLANTSPTRFRKEIMDSSKKLAEEIHSLGFRGVCDFEYIETEDDIYFCELNARYPITYYPFLYGLENGTLHKQSQFTLDQDLSLDLLEERLGGLLWDGISAEGVIPINIPHFADPYRTFTLLMFGYDDVSSLESDIRSRLYDVLLR